MLEDPSAWNCHRRRRRSASGQIAHLFGCLALKPSTGLFGLIVALVCTIADDMMRSLITSFDDVAQLVVRKTTRAERILGV
jgi:hypothetical protein